MSTSCLVTSPGDPLLVCSQGTADVVDVIAAELSAVGVGEHERDHRLPYHSGRNKDWLKVKCLKRQEFAIVGFTDPEKSRVGFGALLLAVNDDKGELTFAGKVGTGFNYRTLRELRARMNKLEVDKPAFKNPPRGAEARRSHWLKPQLVGEVAFTEWTREGILRHPTFQGLREDKSPREIVREEPQAPPPEAYPRKAEAKRPADWLMA